MRERPLQAKAQAVAARHAQELERADREGLLGGSQSGGGEDRMRHPPIKITPEIEAILLREAQLRLESRTIKEIAAQIGASRAYVQGKIASLMHQLERQSV